MKMCIALNYKPLLLTSSAQRASFPQFRHFFCQAVHFFFQLVVRRAQLRGPRRIAPDRVCEDKA